MPFCRRLQIAARLTDCRCERHHVGNTLCLSVTCNPICVREASMLHCQLFHTNEAVPIRRLHEWIEGC